MNGKTTKKRGFSMKCVINTILTMAFLCLFSPVAESLASNGYDGMGQAESLAVKTLLLESEGEGVRGMTAVGEVIRNRAKSGSIEKVIRKPYAFSCWNANELPQSLGRLESMSDESLQKGFRAWHESEHSNLTNGSDHYHTVTSNPSWHRTLPKTVVIGRHCFHKESR